MVGSLLNSDFRGVVIAADVRGFPISLAAALVFARCGLRGVGRDDAAGDRGRRRRAAGADCEEEMPSVQFGFGFVFHAGLLPCVNTGNMQGIAWDQLKHFIASLSTARKASAKRATCL